MFELWRLHAPGQGILHRFGNVDGFGPGFIPRLSPVMLKLMIESSQQLVSPKVDDIVKKMLALEARRENWKELVAMHLSLISCLHAHLKTVSVTLGDLYPNATVFDETVLEKPISMMARTVAQCDAHLTPKCNDSSLHAKSVVLLDKSHDLGFGVAMPHGDNAWLLFETNATGTTARDVLRTYGLIEDRQNALPGMLLQLINCGSKFHFHSLVRKVRSFRLNC